MNNVPNFIMIPQHKKVVEKVNEREKIVFVTIWDKALV